MDKERKQLSDPGQRGEGGCEEGYNRAVAFNEDIHSIPCDLARGSKIIHPLTSDCTLIDGLIRSHPLGNHRAEVHLWVL